MEKQSKKELFFEILRFLIVGGIATICDYAVFYFCNLLVFGKWIPNFDPNWNLVLSTALGFTVGLIVNWLLQKFVYRYISDKQAKSKVVFLKFVIVALIGLGVTELGMYLASPTFNVFNLSVFGWFTFDFWKLFFKVLMTVIVLIWNYIARKLFVFRTKKATIDVAETEDKKEEENKEIE